MKTITLVKNEIIHCLNMRFYDLGRVVKSYSTLSSARSDNGQLHVRPKALSALIFLLLLSFSQAALANKCVELMQKQDYYEAANICSSMAKKGERNAQFSLAILYYQGNGMMSDMVQAQKWMRKAAQQNHNQAQYNLGIMLANGQGSRVNLIEAYAWLKIAAENGYSDAQESVRQLGAELTSGEKNKANEEIERLKKEFK